MSEKRCERCGKTVTNYAYGSSFCDRCAEVWDAVFESTTQHAQEIARLDEEEEEEQLEDLKEINRMANKAEVDYEELGDSVGHELGDESDRWRCGKCKRVRINSDQFAR